MSRDISGNYTLPAGNPVTSGTVIASTWANNTMTDIATVLTASLDRSGNGGMLQPLKLVDGVVAAPGLTFVSEAGIGIYRVGLGQLGFATSGVQRAVVNAAGAWIVNSPSAGTAFTVNALFGAAGIVVASAGSWTQSAPGLTVKSTAANGFAVLSLVPNNGVSGTSDVSHVVNGTTQEYFIINNISGGPTTFRNNAGSGSVTTMSLSTTGNLTLTTPSGSSLTFAGAFPITIGSPSSNSCDFFGSAASQQFRFLPNAVVRFVITDTGLTVLAPASGNSLAITSLAGASSLVLTGPGTVSISFQELTTPPVSQLSAFIGIGTAAFGGTGVNGDLILVPRSSQACGVFIYTGNGTAAQRVAVNGLGNVIISTPVSGQTLTLAPSPAAGELIATSAALTTGAGAGAGTITNAPSAGNPTKWIKINDNGTVRSVPAW